jgi:hypothetical protein
MPLPAVVGAAVSAAGAAEGTALAAEAATAAGLGGVATGFGLVRASMAAVNQQIADFNRGLVATGFQLGIVATAARAAADHMAGAVAVGYISRILAAMWDAIRLLPPWYLMCYLSLLLSCRRRRPAVTSPSSHHHPTAYITNPTKRPDSIRVAAEADTVIVTSSPQQARASTR